MSEDCARANICMAKSDATDRFDNVGIGKQTSLKTARRAHLPAHRVQSADKLCPAQSGDAGAQSHRLPESATREIGFTAKSPLEEGLRRVIAWRDGGRKHQGLRS
jgi:UDP-glucose 4-epimerase